MSFYRILLLVALVQGVFLSLSFLFKNIEKRRSKAKKDDFVNPWFLLLLVTITLSLWIRYLYSAAFFHQYPHLCYASDSMAFFFGPLWYFFIHKKIAPTTKLPTRRDVWFLLPLWFQFGFVGYLFTLSVPKLLNLGDTAWFANTFYGFCVLVIFQNALYFAKAHRLLPHYQKNYPVSFTFIRWFHWVMLGLLGIWSLFFGANLAGLVHHSFVIVFYFFIFVVMAFCVFFMAFGSMHRPRVFDDLHQVRAIRLNQHEQLARLYKELENLFTCEKVYTNPELNLIKLAEKLEVNARRLSQAINTTQQKSFTELISQYRVQHFLDLAKQDENQHLTHWALAQESGFKNKTTFYNAFKKITNTTPKAYLRQLA